MLSSSIYFYPSQVSIKVFGMAILKNKYSNYKERIMSFIISVYHRETIKRAKKKKKKKGKKKKKKNHVSIYFLIINHEA